MLMCRQQQNRRLRTQMEQASFVVSLERRQRQQDESSNLKVGGIAALRFRIIFDWMEHDPSFLQRPAALTRGIFTYGYVACRKTKDERSVVARCSNLSLLRHHSIESFKITPYGLRHAWLVVRRTGKIPATSLPVRCLPQLFFDLATPMDMIIMQRPVRGCGGGLK